MLLVSLKDTLSLFKDNWERYFANLKDVQLGLLAEISKRSMEHENTTDPYRTYVYASKKAKEMLWENLRTRSSFSDTLPQEISRQIYIGQYQRICDEYQSGKAVGYQQEKVDDMFRKDVLGWCRGKLRSDESLNSNVVQALNKESQLTGNDCLKEKIKVLDLIAKPFVPIDTDSSMEYWGINPQVLESMTKQQIQDYFGSSSPSIVHEAFSPYQIIRYRGTYGLKVDNFPKFSSDPNDSGIYYSAYRSRIKDYQAEPLKHITPHLDNRCHLPAFLPDINSP